MGGLRTFRLRLFQGGGYRRYLAGYSRLWVGAGGKAGLFGVMGAWGVSRAGCRIVEYGRAVRELFGSGPSYLIKG